MKTHEPLTNESKNKMLYCFRIVMDEAEDVGHIERNPLRELKEFAKNNKPIEPFTLDELRTLFPLDRNGLMQVWQTQMWLTYFLCMATTGWRPGEVAALRLENWYRSKQALIAKHSVEAGTRVLKDIKTAKRGVKMKAAVVTERLEQELILRENELLDPDELMFHVGNGKPLILDTSNKHFKAACRRAGIDRRARTQYSLRHSFSTDLHAVAGEETVNRLMGHTKYRGEYDHREEEALIASIKSARESVQAIRNLDS